MATEPTQCPAERCPETIELPLGRRQCSLPYDHLPPCLYDAGAGVLWEAGDYSGWPAWPEDEYR